MPDISSAEFGIQKPVSKPEQNNLLHKDSPNKSPSRMQRRSIGRIPGTNRGVNPVVSTGAGLLMVAGGLGLAADAAAEQFGSKTGDAAPSVIVEPVSGTQPENSDMVAYGAHPQKYTEQAPRLVDSRSKETDSQARVSLIAEVFPNLPAGKYTEVNGKLDSVYSQMERDGVFGDMEEIVSKYDVYIDQASKRYDIPKEILYGVFVTETSGNLDALHDSDATGPGIMPAAAEELGISLSDRTNPRVAFDAMAKYLAKYREIYGDNLAYLITNYYAGPGNTGEMIRVAAAGFGLPDPGELVSTNYIRYAAVAKAINLYDLMNDAGVKSQVLSRLDSKTPEYPFRVMAGAKHYSMIVR